jgi:phosphatidate cytidylyltransferase
MKKRIITGVSGALFAIACVVFMQFPLVFGIPLAFFAATAVHEIMHVIGCKNKAITAIGMTVAGAIPLCSDIIAYLRYHRGVEFFDSYRLPVWVLALLLIFVIFIIMLKNYETVKFEHAAMAIFCSLAVGFGMATLIYLRDLDHAYPDFFQEAQSRTIVLCALYAAWIADAFAYFIGRKFGKHKLAPVISPKKSIEGAAAGVIGNAVVTAITWVIASHWFNIHPDTVGLAPVLVVSVIACVAGICGDLSASVIKRNFGAKDFGTFFPGHGGIMDRFDSTLFALPAVYLIITVAMSFAQ